MYSNVLQQGTMFLPYEPLWALPRLWAPKKGFPPSVPVYRHSSLGRSFRFQTPHISGLKTAHGFICPSAAAVLDVNSFNCLIVKLF